MKNYYEILEVDKKASDEIIKVAYKSLVKKYHPDLQGNQEKVIAEDTIKLINEAYDVLSDPIKREEYDRTLMSDTISADDYNYVVNENINLKKQLNYIQEKYYNFYAQNQNIKNNYHENYNQNKYSYDNNNSQQRYYSNTYDKNYKRTIFDKMDSGLKNLISILLTFLIIFAFIKIPFLNSFISNLLNNFYGSNLLFLLFIVILFIIFFRNKK